jgi:LuxR family maltose regulon positive regulatory protein
LGLGETSAALAVLGILHEQAEAKGWEDERLKVMVLQAVALHVHGEKDEAIQLLLAALALAEPSNFIRIFIDEGKAMVTLLTEAASHGIMTDNISKLLAVFAAEEQESEDRSDPHQAPHAQPLLDPLSEREIKILQLITQGFSNREISEQLFLALDTVKGYNHRIYGKLQVQRRTEAVARARELGLL